MYVVPHEGLTFLSSRSGQTKDGRDYHTLCGYDNLGTPFTFFLSPQADKSAVSQLQSFVTGDRIYPLLDVHGLNNGFRITVAGFVNYSD